MTQDRLSEKNFINEIGLATPAYLPVDDADMLVEAVASPRTALCAQDQAHRL